MAGSGILIVKDDQNLLSALKYNLQKEGCDVATAADSTEAIETARRERPKLIVLIVFNRSILYCITPKVNNGSL